MSKYDSFTVNPDFDTAVINKNAGDKFFGSANLGAGINIAIPMGNFGEWRILGITGSLQNEFGQYLQFRQNLEKNNVHVTGLIASNILATTGISSELAFATKTGSFSFHTQLNFLLGKSYFYTDYGTEGQIQDKRYTYVSNSFALTVHRFTGFAQVNTGRHMSNFGMGINYSLLPKKAHTSYSRTSATVCTQNE
ncbi:hypothetical protein BH10BAC2_BH10BAC2_45590 [soil metagenome]